MKNYVIHEFTVSPLCSNGVLAAASVPPGAETWNSFLDHTNPNVHETLKSTLAVQQNAVHWWDRPPCLVVSVWRHRQRTDTRADLYLVTILHVGADTPHILQTHLSSTAQMPRRDV